MSTLAETKQQLVNDLEGADLKVYAFVPLKTSFPCVVVVPSPEYITKRQGQTSGEFTVQMDVMVFAGKDTNEKTMLALDDTTETVLFNTVDWLGHSVAEPSKYSVAGQEVIGNKISIRKPFRLS